MDKILTTIFAVAIAFGLGALCLITGFVLVLICCCIKIDNREVKKPLKYSMLIIVLIGLLLCIIPAGYLGLSEMEITDYLYYLIAEERYYFDPESEDYSIYYKGVRYDYCQYLFNVSEFQPEKIKLAVVEDDYVLSFSEYVAVDGTVLLLEDGSAVLVPADKYDDLFNYYINNFELTFMVTGNDGYNYFKVDCKEPDVYAKELSEISGSDYDFVANSYSSENYYLFFNSESDELNFSYCMHVFVSDGKLVLLQDGGEDGFKCTILPDELSDKLLPMLREAVS